MLSRGCCGEASAGMAPTGQKCQELQVVVEEDPGQVEPRQVEPRQMEPRQVEPRQVEAGQLEAGQLEAGQMLGQTSSLPRTCG